METKTPFQLPSLFLFISTINAAFSIQKFRTPLARNIVLRSKKITPSDLGMHFMEKLSGSIDLILLRVRHLAKDIQPSIYLTATGGGFRCLAPPHFITI